MAKDLTGNLLSTVRPSNQEIFTTPYVLSNNQKTLARKNFISEVDYDFTFESTKADLLSTMQHLIGLERAKEQQFIDLFLEKVRQGDPDFAQQLDHILTARDNEGAGRISLALEAIQLYRSGQWEVARTIEENLQDFTQYWKGIANKVFMSAIHEVTKDILSEKNRTLTITDLMNKVEEKVLNSFLEDMQEAYRPVVKKVFASARNLTQTRFGDTYSDTLEELANGEYVQRKMEKHKARTSSRYQSESVENIMMDYIGGVINGLSAEMYMEAKKLGKSTGRVGMSEKRLTRGAGSKEGRAIQTDVLEVLSMEITSPDIDMTEFENGTIKTLTQMREWLNDIDLEDKLVIHTSVKDYGARSLAIHIRGTKPLDVRLAPLVEICESVNMGKKDIQNLVFALVNAGQHMIANDLFTSGMLTQALAAVSAAYMFEDYTETFSQLDSDTSNHELHVYFINGHYYTMSDILSQSYNQIRQVAPGRKMRGGLIKVTFQPTNEDVFSDDSVKNLVGLDRWEQVRNITLEKSRLGISLNAKQLRDMVLKLEI